MSSRNKPFSAVVVGTGFIGPVHVEGLRRAGVHVAGIVGSTLEKSQIAADQLGVPRGYATLDDVLADPVVDSVHLATPNRLHFAQAAAVLRAGKHVLCEKPLAMTSAVAGDAGSHSIIDRTAEYLSVAAANVVTALHPEMIVFAGGVAEMGELLLAPVRRGIRERVRMFPANDVRVEKSQLGDDAGVRGALAVAIQAFESP